MADHTQHAKEPDKAKELRDEIKGLEAKREALQADVEGLEAQRALLTPPTLVNNG